MAQDAFRSIGDAMVILIAPITATRSVAGIVIPPHRLRSRCLPRLAK